MVAKTESNLAAKTRRKDSFRVGTSYKFLLWPVLQFDEMNPLFAEGGVNSGGRASACAS